jgi:hypothetical protein
VIGQPKFAASKELRGAQNIVRLTLEWCLQNCLPIPDAPASRESLSLTAREELTVSFVLRGRASSSAQRRRILDVAALGPEGGRQFSFDSEFFEVVPNAIGSERKLRTSASRLVHRSQGSVRSAPHHLEIPASLSYLNTHIEELVTVGGKTEALVAIAFAFQVLHPLNSHNGRASRLFCVSHRCWYSHLASIYSYLALGADHFWSETFPRELMRAHYVES